MANKKEQATHNCCELNTVFVNGQVVNGTSYKEGVQFYLVSENIITTFNGHSFARFHFERTYKIGSILSLLSIIRVDTDLHEMLEHF